MRAQNIRKKDGRMMGGRLPSGRMREKRLFGGIFPKGLRRVLKFEP
jgi:hypothetical protein